MTVTTVLGDIEDTELGKTLTHEHLLANAVEQWQCPSSAADVVEFTKPFDLAMRGKVQHNPFAYRSALQQLDFNVARYEVDRFVEAGGRTIVDLSVPAFGRDPVALKALSSYSGINIVMGCGEYVDRSHTSYARRGDAGLIRDMFIEEVTVGVGPECVRAGIIGELGVSNPMTENERKVLAGAAMASIETSTTINLHRTIFPEEMAGLAGLDYLLDQGVDPRRIVVSHCDERPGADFALAVAGRGAWVELDTFGMEQWAVSARRGDSYPTRSNDRDRVDQLEALLENGYLDQVLVSQDMAMKPQTSYYGGWGLTHFMTTMASQLTARGLGDVIDTLMVVNPPKMLSR